MYDEGSVSQEFRALAEQADREFRDFLHDPRDLDGDAILARSCVYGYLYARYFLESNELLLNELRWLQRSGRPRAPAHACSRERFERARDVLIESLIERFDPARS